MTIACQSCGHWPLDLVIDLGYMPSVNVMPKIAENVEQSFFPTMMVKCPNCELVQLGGEAPDPKKVFPANYPYTTASSRPLIENFRQLADEVCALMPNQALRVCDIGSNDGTLLSFFKQRGCEILGIEPTNIADIANAKGIKTLKTFFSSAAADAIGNFDQFDAVTCCNCFAHMPDVNGVVEGIKKLLKPNGIFVSENHYLFDLLRDVQYDTIYHEHLRFYSLRALRVLFDRHDLKIIKVKKIATHGGSIRVYACRKGNMQHAEFWQTDEPTRGDLDAALNEFTARVIYSRKAFHEFIVNAGFHIDKPMDNNMVGIGAPSRGTILINYLGLNHIDLACVAERDGSLKIGRTIPGTRIPIVNEKSLFDVSGALPDYALILSWHMADAIMHNWRAKGYKGKFIIPLPEPRIVSRESAH